MVQVNIIKKSILVDSHIFIFKWTAFTIKGSYVASWSLFVLPRVRQRRHQPNGGG